MSHGKRKEQKEGKKSQVMQKLSELLCVLRVTWALVPLTKGGHSAIPDISGGKEPRKVLNSEPNYHTISSPSVTS